MQATECPIRVRVIFMPKKVSNSFQNASIKASIIPDSSSNHYAQNYSGINTIQHP